MCWDAMLVSLILWWIKSLADRWKGGGIVSWITFSLELKRTFLGVSCDIRQATGYEIRGRNDIVSSIVLYITIEFVVVTSSSPSVPCFDKKKNAGVTAHS